jgi:hypothetical protein
VGEGSKAILIIQWCGSGMFFPDTRSLFYPSRIQQPQQKRKGKMCCPTFFYSHKYLGSIKLKIFVFFNKYSTCKEKKIEPVHKELWLFLPPKMSLSCQKYRFGIRDPRSGIQKKPFPDPGVKTAPDPGSGSATLHNTGTLLLFVPCLFLPFAYVIVKTKLCFC